MFCPIRHSIPFLKVNLIKAKTEMLLKSNKYQPAEYLQPDYVWYTNSN
jgi:hypothetical protein